MTGSDTVPCGDVDGALAAAVVDAVRVAFGRSITPAEALIRPAPPRRGADFQANLALSMAKDLGCTPRDAAERIAARLDAPALDRVSVEGAGFLNLVVSPHWLGLRLLDLAGDDRLGLSVDAPSRIVVDYSGPNAAKEMHVGHLRSTILGDAITRIARFAGHEVIAQNHLGDWGTPFGMLLEALMTGDGPFDPDSLAIEDLNGFYREARERFDAEPAFAERARSRVVALQAGDPPTMAAWRALVAESQRHFDRIYDLLGVALRPGDVRGESAYNAELAGMVNELGSQGLVVESDGAWCAFPEGFQGRDGTRMPFMVRKSDGGYTYATTDLAALRHRIQVLRAGSCVYVVGAAQQLHFDLLRATAREAGWINDNALRYCGFGSVLGEDGKVLRSRAGGGVRLIDLLEEAVVRAGALVEARSDIPPAQRPAVARAVGIGAVKYADLSNSRERDYVFSFDRMLAMDGNTAVYLQYANARIRSVLGKAGSAGRTPVVLLTHEAERNLAISLTRFPAVIRGVLDTLEPHRLCTYLYETAGLFSTFYEHCPILTSPPDERQSRLVLCEVASATLTTGLDLLGIEAPPRL